MSTPQKKYTAHMECLSANWWGILNTDSLKEADEWYKLNETKLHKDGYTDITYYIIYHYIPQSEVK